MYLNKTERLYMEINKLNNQDTDDLFKRLS